MRAGCGVRSGHCLLGVDVFGEPLRNHVSEGALKAGSDPCRLFLNDALEAFEECEEGIEYFLRNI